MRLWCLDSKLHSGDSFSCFDFFFCIVIVLAEAVIITHCLLEAFPDLPFFFALRAS